GGGGWGAGRGGGGAGRARGRPDARHKRQPGPTQLPQFAAMSSEPRIRLAVITTHPIQYYAPVFRALAASGPVRPRVFYTWSQTESGAVFDPGFGREFAWDVPLLEGYEYEFVPNVARRSGRGFWGIRTPALAGRIERWGADAVLVYGWNTASHLSAIWHFKGRVPVFFRGDSTILDPQPTARRWLRRAALRFLYANV